MKKLLLSPLLAIFFVGCATAETSLANLLQFASQTVNDANIIEVARLKPTTVAQVQKNALRVPDTIAGFPIDGAVKRLDPKTLSSLRQDILNPANYADLMQRCSNTYLIGIRFRAGSRRSVSIETPDTSLILIEMYAKDVLLEIPEYQSYDSSLKQFAVRYNGRDIAGKLQANQPITQESVQRNGKTGLKETQKFIVADIINDTMIREYYRADTDSEIVFISMDTSVEEFQNTAAGFDLILGSFKYE